MAPEFARDFSGSDVLRVTPIDDLQCFANERLRTRRLEFADVGTFENARDDCREMQAADEPAVRGRIGAVLCEQAQHGEDGIASFCGEPMHARAGRRQDDIDLARIESCDPEAGAIPETP
jgi:hypothetical protein